MPTADQYYGLKELFHFRWFVLISYFVADQEPVLEEPTRLVTALLTSELEHDIQITLITVERNLEIIEIISPDSQVQMACWPHTYKSYSYCLNNPLIYTDPDGEFITSLFLGPVGVFIDAALWSGTINLVSNWKSIDNFGEGLAVFGAGAAQGALIGDKLVRKLLLVLLQVQFLMVPEKY